MQVIGKSCERGYKANGFSRFNSVIDIYITYISNI